MHVLSLRGRELLLRRQQHNFSTSWLSKACYRNAVDCCKANVVLYLDNNPDSDHVNKPFLTLDEIFTSGGIIEGGFTHHWYMHGENAILAWLHVVVYGRK